MTKTSSDLFEKSMLDQQQIKVQDGIQVKQQNVRLKEQLDELTVLLKLSQIHANNRVMIIEQAHKAINQHDNVLKEIQENKQTIEELKQKYETQLNLVKSLEIECIQYQCYDANNEEILQQHLSELNYVQNKNEKTITQQEKQIQALEEKYLELEATQCNLK